MAEYIERETLKILFAGACAECRDSCAEFDGIEADCNQCLLNGVIKDAKSIPSADLRPVKRGKWLKYAPDNSDMMTCSECEKYWILDGEQYDFHFCPNCGADMREES